MNTKRVSAATSRITHDVQEICAVVHNSGLTKSGQIINDPRDRRPAIRLGGMLRNVFQSVWLGLYGGGKRCGNGKKRDNSTRFHRSAVSFQKLEAPNVQWTVNGALRIL